MVDQPDWDLRLGYLIHDVSRAQEDDVRSRTLGAARDYPLAMVGARIHLAQGTVLPQTQLANELECTARLRWGR